MTDNCVKKTKPLGWTERPSRNKTMQPVWTDRLRRRCTNYFFTRLTKALSFLLSFFNTLKKKHEFFLCVLTFKPLVTFPFLFLSSRYRTHNRYSFHLYFVFCEEEEEENIIPSRCNVGNPNRVLHPGTIRQRNWIVLF